MLFQMILLLFLIFSAGMLSVTSGNTSSIPSVQEYFPEIENDLTKVEWAHAVNSQNLLGKALENSKVMMLEADVVLGTLKKDSKDVMPIMAHPPANTSDLSLQVFLEAVINAQSDKRKGVKLDFKTIEAFEASCKVMDSFFQKFTFPVFLNADILPGPINSTTKPLNPDVFLALSSKTFPSTTLSLGWTTAYGPGKKGNYSQDQLDAMLEVLKSNKISQPVTLCLRAGIVAETQGIKELIESIDRYQNSNSTTVTIWMSNNIDPVNVPKLKDLIIDLDKSRVFLDVPEFIKNDLYLFINAEKQRTSSKSPISAAQGAIVALLTSVSTFFSKVL